MSDLSEFLLARIAEDEAVAREAQARVDGYYADPRAVDVWSVAIDGPVWKMWHAEDDRGLTGAVAAKAARILAECAAKRRIVEEYLWDGGPSGRDTMTTGERRHRRRGLKVALRYLAQPYSDHPDFREEWRA